MTLTLSQTLNQLPRVRLPRTSRRPGFTGRMLGGAMAMAAAAAILGGAAPALAQGVFYQVFPPDSNFGGWNMQAASSVFSNIKVVGDYDGDGADDLFWHYAGTLPNGQAPWATKIFRGSAGGTFSTYYDTEGIPAQTISPNLGTSIDLINLGARFLAGDFVGNDSDEMLVYSRLTIGNEYRLLDWGLSSTPLQLTRIANNQIGDAVVSFDGIRLFAADVLGDGRDELISLEATHTGVRARIQRYDPSLGVRNFVTLWQNNNSTAIGGWNINWNQDEFYFADFVSSNNTSGVKKELLCINKTNGWLKIIAFNQNTLQWNDLYTNLGNGHFHPNGAATPNDAFNTQTTLQVGNFDASDPNVEIVFYQGNNIASIRSVEYNQFGSQMTAVRSDAMQTANIFGNVVSTNPWVTAYERWSTPRVCVRRFLGICTKWSGGLTTQQTRQFHSQVRQRGAVEIITGNFRGGLTEPNLELLAFYDSATYLPNITPNVTFVTSCVNNHMFSGACGTSIHLYNLLGQLINTYYPATQTFASQVILNPTRYALLDGAGNFLHTPPDDAGIQTEIASDPAPAQDDAAGAPPQEPEELTCLADWNNDGAANSLDVFEFINDFLDGSIDLNGNEVTDTSDFFTFLTAYLAGC